MSRSRDLAGLLARSRPARLDPPPNRHDAEAVAAITADERPAVRHAEPRARRTPGRVLAAAAAVVAVAVTGGAIASRDTSPDPAVGAGSTSAPAAAPGDAGLLLLAAAERSDTAASGGGRYLTLQTEYGAAVPVSTADGSYTMLSRSIDQYWLARTDADRSWVIAQSLGATPATAADEAAWQRAGSPTVVNVTEPKPHELRTTPGRVHGNTVNPANLFAIGSRNMTQKQLDALPTNPAALRKLLISTFDGGGGDMPTDRTQWLLGVTASLVVGLPVSNPVRAAAYRVLAELPGVRDLGAVRDVRGRAGQAVAFVEDGPRSGSFEVRLIIDVHTGQALAQERRPVRPRGRWSWIAPGALASYQAVLLSGTTDDKPPKVDVVD